jgi:hypothetical protein
MAMFIQFGTAKRPPALGPDGERYMSSETWVARQARTNIDTYAKLSTTLKEKYAGEGKTSLELSYEIDKMQPNWKKTTLKEFFADVHQEKSFALQRNATFGTLGALKRLLRCCFTLTRRRTRRLRTTRRVHRHFPLERSQQSSFPSTQASVPMRRKTAHLSFARRVSTRPPLERNTEDKLLYHAGLRWNATSGGVSIIRTE